MHWHGKNGDLADVLKELDRIQATLQAPEVQIKGKGKGGGFRDGTKNTPKGRSKGAPKGKGVSKGKGYTTTPLRLGEMVPPAPESMVFPQPTTVMMPVVMAPTPAVIPECETGVMVAASETPTVIPEREVPTDFKPAVSRHDMRHQLQIQLRDREQAQWMASGES